MCLAWIRGNRSERGGGICLGVRLENLESRRLLSAGGGSVVVPKVEPAPVVPPAVVTPHRKSHTQNFLISFYGFGGGGFSNDWVATTAEDAGAVGAYIVRKYQETQVDTALKSMFKSMDLNGDHTISTSEIAGANVRVLGYSFGAIAGANFTRELTRVSRPVDGYKLAAAVPVKALVTVDPVNYTGLRHTDGPAGNVEKFVSYYELNPGSSAITLTNRSTGRSAGTAPFGGTNPVGGPLASSAKHTSQTLVDFGSPADEIVSHRYSKNLTGTLTGADVNHSTMPWYCYPAAVEELTT